jgi:flagellar hook-associated protein FlgK
MELLQEALPQQVQTSTHASDDFQHPLLELEAYVNQSQNQKLTDSFRKFKDALTEPASSASGTALPEVALPVAGNVTSQTEDRSYLAMSSVFTMNVKHW